MPTAGLRQPVPGDSCFRRGSERPFSRKALEHEMTGTEKQKTILLVEDEAITAMAEKMALAKYGYTVITASSGEEAVDTIKKTPAIDLILMDINLGKGMDGTEAAALILRQRDMPVVFLSSHMEPEVVAKTEKITSYGYVVKDSSITVLDASIKMAFKLFAAKIREKEKEEALREGEDRMRAIVEGTPQLFFYIQDARANTTYVSPTIENITGYKAETWMKRKDWFITDAPVNQLAKERTQEHLRGNFKREPVLLEIRHANGDPLLLEAYEYPIFKDGKVVGLQGVAHDITQRKHAEEELNKRNQYIESILDNMPIGFAVNTIDDGVARYVNDKFTEIYGWQKEVLTDVDRFFASVYPGPEGQELKARVIRDMGSGDPEKMAWDDLKITTSTGEHRYISARNIPILEQNLMVSTVWDTTRAHESQQALQKSEERYHSILKASPDGIVILDLEGQVLMASPAIMAIFGFAHEEELLGQRFTNFIVANDCERAAANVALMFQGTMTGPGEYRGLRANGDTIDIEVNGEFVRNADGHPTQIVLVVRNISARQRAESQREAALTALEESKERYENFISQISDGVYRFEPDVPMPLTLPVEEQIDYLYRHMFIAECNPSLMDMYGIKEPGDILGKTQMDFHGGSDNPLNRQVMRDFIQCGYKTKNVITEEIDIHGNKKYFSNNTIGIIKNNHLIRMWGTQTDISEQKRAQEALQESEDRFRTLYENSPLGLYRTTPDGRIQLANPALIRMLGYSSFAELAKIDLQRDGFTPSHSRSHFLESIEESGEVKGLEFAWQRKDGTSVLVRESARAIRDAQGKTLYFDGIVEDISELKRTETQKEAALKALQESENKYRAMVETASDLVYRTDKAGHITFANPAALTITGYEEGELKGKHYFFLIRPDMRKEAIRLFLRQIKKGTHNTYSEFPILTKDGREIWLGQNIQLITEANRVTGFQAVSRDISERKRAEEAVKKSEDKFRTIFDSASDGMFIIDLKTRKFLLCNTMCTKMLGYNQEEFSNLDVADIHPGEDLPFIYEQIRKFSREEEGVRSDIRFKRKNGSIFESDLSPALLTIAEDNCLLISFKDISERKRAEEEIKRQLAEKEVLLKEVHHRIKNNIASISGLISLQMQTLSNPQAIAILRDAIGRVDNMRLLYDKLLLTENYENLSVKNYLDNLIDTIVAIFPSPVMIKLEKQIADFHLDAKRLFPLGSIINELLTNIMKYAFHDRKTGLIKISLAKVNHHITLAIQDNGRGLPPGFDIGKAKGFGLMLVKMLSQQLGGNFAMETRKGTRCTLEFDV